MRLISNLLLAASLSLSGQTLADTTPLNVVTTIKPLQLIVADLIGDAGKVDVLLPPGSSPHHFTLKPSQIRTLAEADMVVWVGEDMERFMVKMLGELDTPHFTMVEAVGDSHDEHDGHADHEEHHGEHQDHTEHETHHHEDHDEHHEKHNDHADHHEAHVGHNDHHDEHHDEHAKHDEHHNEHAEESGHHDHDHSVDLHYWLDPMTSLAFAHELKEKLEAQYPALAATLDANYAALEAAIKAEDKLSRDHFAAIDDKGFFVFHDAWGHYVSHYGLNQLGYFTVDPGRRPGAKHLKEIREQLVDQKAACVFTEPQFKPAIVAAIAEGLDVNTQVLDPLASDFSVGNQSYARYLAHLRGQIVSCLQ
ncbi:MAG: zinc ABC transporter substrate-binding protein [Pontibacterium sp.]